MVAAMAAGASAEIEIVTNRCIVPATSFCEYADTKPRETPAWFALAEVAAAANKSIP
jgi:putative SOS response-associated peptidase YedK